ncbi:MAG TPA: hypothetical protein P5234_13885 [Thermoanaerobaculaceae bacterium]|nr:hypothetical protein [Thermoanaerobaculaceae bacterium]HRS17320.1 hypothetical protein [Thermoanaerobaculaceae bacterium]
MNAVTRAVVVAAAWAMTSSMLADEPPCRAYRLVVRTGVDSAVGQIDLERARKATIAELRALPTPDPQSVQDDRRVPAEKQLYRVRGVLVQQRTGEQRDYVLVLEDERKNTLLAEISAPSCVPATSPFFQRQREAFRRLDERLHMDEQSLQIGLAIPIEITGVGFFDLEHFGSPELPGGMAPNLFELNPILDVKFR